MNWIIGIAFAVFVYYFLVLTSIPDSFASNYAGYIAGAAGAFAAQAAGSYLNARQCPRCGKRVKEGRMDCPDCGFDFRTVGQTPPFPS
jgi:hypothetical protein